jgi:hypothetical protein
MYDTFLRHQEQDVRAFKESGPEIKKKKREENKTDDDIAACYMAGYSCTFNDMYIRYLRCCAVCSTIHFSPFCRGVSAPCNKLILLLYLGYVTPLCPILWEKKK